EGINFMRVRREVAASARKDTIDEWRQITDRMQLQLDECLGERHKQAVTLAEQAGEVRLLQITVQRLQAVTGDDLTAALQPAIVTADLESGVIRQASPAITPLTHWLVKDLIGKSVEVLIPERFLA